METKNKKIKINDNIFNILTNQELLQVAKRTNDFPLKISNPVPLTNLVNFYYRYWNYEIPNDDSIDSL